MKQFDPCESGSLVFTGQANIEAERKRACVQAPPAYKEVEIGAHHIVMMYLEKYMGLVFKSYESIFSIFKVVPEYKKMLNVEVNPQISIFNLQVCLAVCTAFWDSWMPCRLST
jgi:hypothetical protein